MLFLVSHRHSVDRCPGNQGKEAADKHYRSLQTDVAARLGIKIVALYTAPIEHARFIVLQTDSFEALRDYLEPLYLIGEVEVFPVSSFEERVHSIGARLEAPPTDYYCMTCRANFFETEMGAHKTHKYYSQKQMEEIWPHELGGEAGGG
ncbi:MAG: hypothetical protein JRN51_08610 [Nitrososphaerota archaeon]|nr:hypothetical protein [Nitrososphaerota archaeon]MDG6967346.1 hypothetical protein [Nitrososphaerota archaeon]MDG6978424.1 hypothetical protein [Nitrososphaerota archaeon]MDG6981153.1 hypothetical protein [Nitrososphaerota archaeon]